MHKENDYIKRYKTYLRLEKALSGNSIDAYLTDLDKLTLFLESEGKSYEEVTYNDLQQFISQLHDIGIHPRSQARIISGIKSFYKFLLLDNYITIDPTEQSVGIFIYKKSLKISNFKDLILLRVVGIISVRPNLLRF